jgi:predicted Zn-dependent protease
VYLYPNPRNESAGHADPPDLDESQSIATPAQERKLGESVVRQIRASGAYLDDPEVNDYLNDLGHRLVAAQPDSTFEFEFFAMADPTINAFALPGGFIAVNMGLILLAQSESELAAVLAHEISHVTQHIPVRWRASNARFCTLSRLALAMPSRAGRRPSRRGGLTAAGLTQQLNHTRERI